MPALRATVDAVHAHGTVLVSQSQRRIPRLRLLPIAGLTGSIAAGTLVIALLLAPRLEMRGAPAVADTAPIGTQDVRSIAETPPVKP